MNEWMNVLNLKLIFHSLLHPGVWEDFACVFTTAELHIIQWLNCIQLHALKSLGSYTDHSLCLNSVIHVLCVILVWDLFTDYADLANVCYYQAPFF